MQEQQREHTFVDVVNEPPRDLSAIELIERALKASAELAKKDDRPIQQKYPKEEYNILIGKFDSNKRRRYEREGYKVEVVRGMPIGLIGMHPKDSKSAKDTIFIRPVKQKVKR